ncbi:thioesterase II family protein [Streptomyces marincola]|uniref:thioesterase II family protein n=1 Tax=Streptomyces marincola TaxID=2878388 RepID=UPI001CF59FB0|nr:alpha/beta fold hydrolase [Streptomyces marincola]UCM87039.1 alpha/beta fold hydrolase [Streptomyces marincola]
MSSYRSELGPWLRRPVARPEAGLRLVCFPHAGGGAAAFRPWQRLLPEGVEPLTVQYPGREDRFADRPVGAMPLLVAEVVAAVEPLLDRPYALFGHSMGSAVAFEVAVELRRRGHRPPVRLLAAGRPSPHHARAGDVHRGDDDALAAELVRQGGTPREVLADPDLRAAVLRYVREDYRLIETYRPSSAEPLSCPVSVLRGADDPECGERAALTWSSTTRGELKVTVFAGGHFFLVPQRARVAETIGRDLGAHAGRPVRAWPSTP